MENDNQYYLYGMHPVTDAVRQGRKFERILFRKGLEGEQFRALLDEVTQRGIPYQFVPGEKMNRIVKGAHQGVVAYLAQIDYVSFEEMVEGALSRKANPIFLLLDGISDVRNLGAIARSAECAGIDGIVVPERGSAAINADAVKTSAGALLRIPTARVPNLRTALYYFRDSDFQIVAASEKAEDAMYDVNFRKASVIVMGSEGSGISEPVLSLCTVGARIPMSGQTGSLNVSVAAALVMFEAVRQRMS
ncbi:MAG: 23S rRNA (guanosine(2251)-2'-O)-methyltransferase RlmB [Bacteroidales bacterium]|nr:23S rRNA (guanosine(2251)-2'-O)-methyltransferase RlmB [Bacteroidales bacterium]MBQ1707546.1 23S rRNA (guanosine(2251)-2'-O)-methyltransferase RlmB [Bacteroidales bacterium]MBQ2598847.1 23S rRNA (guanosine(2251)-2'-O)-methyltransferase RlmB [Bacteroidales bacterium]